MFSRRISVLICFFLFIFSALMGRCGYYQLVKGPEIARQAANMRSQKINLKEYSRGDILDRNLLPLTSRQSTSALYCLPRALPFMQTDANLDRQEKSDAAEKNQSYRQIAHLLAQALKNNREEEILHRLLEAEQKGGVMVQISSDLNQAEINRINALHLPGLVVAPVLKRYGDDNLCSHLLGYVSAGGEGKAGLEKTYDSLLRNQRNSLQLTAVLDARGQPIEGLMFKLRGQSGQSNALVLTIDRRIQEIVEEAMDAQVSKGAVIVLDAKSKEILAMASRPNFSPYQVAQLIRSDKNSSLTNRALSRYYPGSLFKIAVSIAALGDGVLTMQDSFDCTGKYTFNEQVAISCWKEEGHGRLSFAQAFAFSCNPAFIEVGLREGRERLREWVEDLHLIDESIVGYNPGLAGTYVKIDGGEPALGNACLGQEGVMLTPLQLASLLAAIADEGYWGPPSLVRYTIDQKGKKHPIMQAAKKRIIDEKIVKEMKKLLKKVVEEGTGKSAALPETAVAGKTATSQTGQWKNSEEEVLNTWFAGYYPADDPRWVVVVLVEEGESGAASSAPVFRQIAREMLGYFSLASKVKSPES